MNGVSARVFSANKHAYIYIILMTLKGRMNNLKYIIRICASSQGMHQVVEWPSARIDDGFELSTRADDFPAQWRFFRALLLSSPGGCIGRFVRVCVCGGPSPRKLTRVLSKSLVYK